VLYPKVLCAFTALQGNGFEEIKLKEKSNAQVSKTLSLLYRLFESVRSLQLLKLTATLFIYDITVIVFQSAYRQHM
jgi:hypothetical protein